MMTDTIVKDVEHLKAQMDSMKNTQDDIRDSIKDIAQALNELLLLRKSHDYHEIELVKLREQGHQHEKDINKSKYEIDNLKRLDDRINSVEKTENEIKVSQAKNGVIITIITTIIVIVLSKITNGVL